MIRLRIRSLRKKIPLSVCRQYLFFMSINKYLLFFILIITGCGTPLPYSGKILESVHSWGKKGSVIQGTLCAPRSRKQQGKMPGILLIAGTPGDRDWNAPPMVINSGLSLARAVSLSGCLTLRYDSPGRGRSAVPGILTKKAGIDALLNAHKLLKSLNRCDPGRIIWIAHGDAALTALSAAQEVRPYRLILLCPPGMSMQRSLKSQIRDALKRRGLDRSSIGRNIAILQKGLDQLYSGEKLSVPRKGVEPALLHALEKLHSPEIRKYSRWYLRATPLAPRLPSPDRIIMGGKDAQYPPALHKKLWIRHGFSPQRITLIPKMDHMLKLQKRDIHSMLPGEILRSYTETGRPLSATLLRTLAAILR